MYYDLIIIYFVIKNIYRLHSKHYPKIKMNKLHFNKYK